MDLGGPVHACISHAVHSHTPYLSAAATYVRKMNVPGGGGGGAPGSKMSIGGMPTD